MRRSKAMDKTYEELKGSNPLLLSLAEELKAAKSNWVPSFIAIASLRNLIHSKEEVLNVIFSLCSAMDNYKRTLKIYDFLLSELDNLDKGDK